MLHAAAQPAADSSIETVTVERGRLTLSVQNALLGEVLEAIGEEAGIAIEIHGDLSKRITTSFNDILLEEGLRQLLRGQSFALSYAPSASDAERSRLIAISVLARSRVEPAAKARKVSTVVAQRDKLRRIRALARQKDAKAVSELSALALSDPSPFVRSRAVSALGRLRNQETLAPLTWALKDQSSSVRIQALQGIKNLKGADAIGDLQAMAANDPDPRVRRQAVRLLSTIRSPEVASLLQWAVSDQDAAVSREAKRALRRWEQRFGTQYGTVGMTH
ncbi:MAG TPA: HEAT repeat domain-containing protein [Candidatus Binatia bacterium]|nr:HEAT repeat domain-containing protein [Candidatus Binatia bacterium]